MAQNGTTQAAFDMVGRISAAPNLAGVLDELRGASHAYGLSGFCISGLPLPHEDVEPYVLLSGWPDGWLEHYAGRGFIHVDPVVRHVRRSVMPFAWADAPVAEDDRAGLQVMDDAAGLGLRAGVTVPIYTTEGCQALVTFGTDSLELSAQEHAALHLVAIYAHSKARALLGEGGAGPARRRPGLSGRELECLKWSADGKSAWETGVILGISQRTVEQHLGTAVRKLSSTNRVQAVAEALRHNLIT